MPLGFNALLQEAGLDPAQVRLLRHQASLPDGRIPLDLWHGDVTNFDAYQSYQGHALRARFARPWWASFAGTRDGRTLFVGLYQVGAPVLLDQDVTLECTGQFMAGGTHDRYPIALSGLLGDYAGRLYIEWGGGSSGKRARSQRADVMDKPITELHINRAQAPFPGLLQLAKPLSEIMTAPPDWSEHLGQARGIYLLSCPDTGAHYVGSASGKGGFWSRWFTYDADGHGGNVALIEQDRKDWIVSILEVAGSTSTSDDILASEALWKRKLQSRTFGFNRN